MRHSVIMILCALIFSSCAAPATPTPANMAFVDIPKPERNQEISTSQAIPTATYIPTAAKIINVSIWVPPYLAETLGGALADPLRGLFVPDAATANIRLEVGEQNLVSQWVYALVTPFSSTLQGVSSDDLLLAGRADPGCLGNQPLLMDQNTYDMFSAMWGPAARHRAYRSWRKMICWIMPGRIRPALAIVPFEALEPRWKVLPVDGLSPIHKDFDLENYRLKIPISLNSDPELIALIKSNFEIPAFESRSAKDDDRCHDRRHGVSACHRV